jgi:predicted PP-loop superfamily ATPase
MLVKQAATTRVTVLRAERAKLIEEMEFYAKNPAKAPPKLQRQVSESTQTLAAQERFLAEQDSEIQRVNARFDQELKRLVPLWHAKQ